MTGAVRVKRLAILAVIGLGLAGCFETSVSNKPDPLAGDIIDEAGLGDLLLQAGSADESIDYFSRALAREPNRADFRRGLAISYTRAKRYPEAARLYQEMISASQATPQDRLDYAFVTFRLERWDEARALVRQLPPDLDTVRRHTAVALLADHQQNWSAADISYGRARTLAVNPAPVLNNWGVSRMSRGDLDGAVRDFEEALSYDGQLFSAKNNLAIARGLRGQYTLPVVPMTEEEKAIILNNIGLIALRKGRVGIARGLFASAVEVHPSHYQAAAERLAALENGPPTR